jgi:hypothetical protein
MNFQRLAISAFLMLVIGLSIGTNPYVVRQLPQLVSQTVADSNTARVVLKAPDKARIGQLIVLDVSESVAASFKWEVRAKTPNFLVIDNGKRAVFSTEVGGEFTFTIAAAKGDTIDVVIHTIKIDGVPSPTDDLATRVAVWCDPVASPTKRDDALKLAQSFSSLSALITPQMTPEEIISATKNSTRDALGDNLKHWTPFLDGLGEEMTKLSAAGQLNDADSHRRVWKAIADALGDYAETL